MEISENMQNTTSENLTAMNQKITVMWEAGYVFKSSKLLEP